MVFTKPRSFTGAGHGAHSRPSSSLLWNGSIGFNNRRLLEPIGNIPPAEAEQRHYAMLGAVRHGGVDSNKMASAKTRSGSD